MEYQVARGGDTTIKMHSVKVLTSSNRMSTNGKLGKHNSVLSMLTDSESDLLDKSDDQLKFPITLHSDEQDTRESEVQIETTKIAFETEITYHRLYKFGELFKLYNLTLQMLEKSFSPKRNHDQVFNAGEGSGKSGSFFFLTHDKKFMIKTISKAEA